MFAFKISGLERERERERDSTERRGTLVQPAVVGAR